MKIPEQFPHRDLSVMLRRRRGIVDIDADSRQARTKWLDSDQPNRLSGWTTIAPVPLDSTFISPAQEVLRSLKEDYSPGEWSIHPFSSLHMTIFAGFSEPDLSSADYPEWVFRHEHPWQAWDEARERLAAATFPVLSAPLEVEVIGFESLASGASATVRPTSDIHQEWLIQAREAVSQAIEWRGRNHDSYRFHITFAYRLTPASLGKSIDLQKMEEHYVSILREAGPVTLETPAFSLFESMLSFPSIFPIVG